MATNTSIQNMPGWENATRGYAAKYPTREVLLEHGTGSANTERMVAQHAAGDPPPNHYTSTPGVHTFGPKGTFSHLMPLVRADGSVATPAAAARNLKEVTHRGGVDRSGK